MSQSARVEDRVSASMGSNRLRARLTLQDIRELFLEAVEAGGQALYMAHEMVEGNHCRNRCEQPHGSGYQRLRDAGCDMGQRRLSHVGESAKGIHDPPHRSEQANVRTDG